MRLIVNVDCLIPPLTGVGHYALGILRELIKYQEVEDLRGFSSLKHFDRRALSGILESSSGAVPDGHAAAIRKPHASAPEPNPIHLRAMERVRPLLARVPGLRAARRAARTWVLQRQAQALAGYIYWEPNYLLMPYAGASVTVIHDLSHVRYPSCHPKSRVAELTERLPQTLRCASRVVAVSAFTREELRACFPEVGDVAVVSPAVDKAFFNVTEERASLVAARYNLPSRYILSVATLEPRKNLQALLRAWSCLPPELQQSAPLVLAGHKGWLSEELSRQMEGFETRGLVRYLGYVPRADMAPLVAGATVLAYVSIYEGFGMPIAEAMAAGTAVVTSSTASMPEVADGAAYLVNPYSSESIRAGLSVLLCDDALRESYVARGRERAKCFTWQSSANALLDVVRPLAAR